LGTAQSRKGSTCLGPSKSKTRALEWRRGETVGRSLDGRVVAIEKNKTTDREKYGKKKGTRDEGKGAYTSVWGKGHRVQAQ